MIPLKIIEEYKNMDNVYFDYHLISTALNNLPPFPSTIH
jgi:hypothetical protein